MSLEEERPARLANVAGALLLGGSSSRMGRDKARLSINGVTLGVRTARLLSTLCEEVLLVGGVAPAGAPGRAVADPPGPPCALRGLVGALEAASAERVLVLATDLPLLREDLLLALTAWPEADVVLPCPEGRLQPLCAIYRRERVLVRARDRLRAGDLALAGLLDELDLARLEDRDLAAIDPSGEMLSNANTPEDWACIEARVRADT